MHKLSPGRWHKPRRQQLFLSISLVALALAAAACFRPSGAGLEATAVALGAPTYTPVPSDTPPPPPTLTPSETPTELPTITPSPFIPTETPTPPLFVTLDPERFLVTEVAMLPQAQDPIILTATALAIGAQPIQPVIQDPIQPVTDPLALTATAIVSGATLTAAYPFTQTAEAILGPTLTPTSSIIVPGTPLPGATPIIPGTDCIHIVQASDRNLFRISLAYGLTVNQIAAASGIVNPSLILIGQRLVIPGCGTTGYRPPVSGDAGAQSGGTTSPGTNVCGPTYTVQQGETLFQISLRCGVPVMTIAQLSGITNINLIFINQELRLQ
jgi:LysM repeat protein